MTRERAAAVALAVGAVAAKVLTLRIDAAVGAAWAGGADTGVPHWLEITLGTTVQLLYLGLTCLLVARRPRHPVTWLMVAIVVLSVLGELSEALTAQLDTTAPPGTLPWWGEAAAWVRTWYFAPFVGAYLLLFHLFPTGRPVQGPLRWASRAAVLAVALLTVAMMTGPADGADYANPLEVAWPRWVSTPVQLVVVVTWAVTVLSIVPILVVRLRRSTGEERQQVKWFVFCSIAALVLWWLQNWAHWLFLVIVLLPGVAIAVGLLRYRLYDVDRVISRTTSYAVVTGLLLATYAVIAAGASKVVGSDSPLAVAVATLVAAALARPVLRRVQDAVDRRFDRSRYDAIRTVDSFGSTLRSEVDLGEVNALLTAAVQSSLQPTRVGLWLNDRA